MKQSLVPESTRDLEARLEAAHDAFLRRYPGDSQVRQPVHVVYGGAHLFKSNTIKKLGELALRSLDEFAPDFLTFAAALNLCADESLAAFGDGAHSLVPSMDAAPEGARRENPRAWFAYTIYRRVREKLQREPVEDFRIDFEDGYGNRRNEEEDHHAEAAAQELAAAMADGQLPPFIGIRVKPLTEELRARSIRTLDIFLTTLASRTNRRLPQSFRVTLPKVTIPEEVEALAELCSRLESALGIEAGALKLELMIETQHAIFNEKGAANLLPLVHAAQGRCLSVHFGPYDYTASRNLVETNRALSQFASDFAREVMQVTLARTGIVFADGPTNIMPIPPHRSTDGAALSSEQIQENREVVHRAWKLHFDNVHRSLHNGFYQGWDLHPAQLPARYAAVYSFFLENLDSASERMRNFIDKAAQATRVGQVFDDAAMAQGLLNYFLRAMNCGAVSADEIEPLTNLSLPELRTGSFAKILDGRRAKPKKH